MDAQVLNGQLHPRALREAHAHLPWLGRALDMLSLEGCTSAAEAIDRIGRRTGESAKGDWILARSARVAAWSEASWFSRPELDRATGDAPTLAMSFDHHAVFANSAALAKAGIRRETPDPDGGIIVRDSSGEPTGLLLEAAAFSAWALAPEPAPAKRADLIARAVDHLAGLGFVEVHDLFSPPWLGRVLADLRTQGRCVLRVGLFVPLDDVESAAQSRSEWENEGLRLLGGKVFTDGTLNSRTAWMLEPYLDAPAGLEHGKPLMNADQVAGAVNRCAALGLGLAMHAIGDGAVRACLDGVARSGRAGRSAIRIEHCELIDERDVPRFAELGVIASVQPCHLLADVEALRAGVGDRLHRVMPWRDLLRAGLVPGETLLFGSDVPVVSADPNDSIRAATRRSRPGDAEAIAPEQSISESEAWRCFRATENE